MLFVRIIVDLVVFYYKYLILNLICLAIEFQISNFGIGGNIFQNYGSVEKFRISINIGT